MDSDSRVLVTGATGFIAGWIIKGLLEAGATVHAAVRDPANTSKLSHLLELAESLPGEIKFFQADLLKEGSYEKAMQGCDTVFHTASPFTLMTDDPQKDLIDPALKGTQNVLNQANHLDTVRRIVVTSSYLATIGDNIDLQSLNKSMLDESDWNSTSSVEHQPYAFSKVLAEKEAWRIADSQDSWILTTINPAFVMGPSLSNNPTSESYHFMKKCGDGSLASGVPDLSMAFVDVREVAQAHLRAATVTEARGRYLVSAGSYKLYEIIGMLKNRYGNQFPFPKRVLPKWLVWSLGPLVDETLTRRGVSRNIGYPLLLNNSRSIDELSITYRPVSDTICEMFQQMIDREEFISNK